MYIERQEDLCEVKFAGYKDLIKVTFGPDVSYIPENCFNDCNNLKEIIFKGNIDNIEAAAFMNCNKVQTIKANNINIIKDFAFYGCDNIYNFDIKEDIGSNIKYGTNNDILSQYFILPEIGISLNDVSWQKLNLISQKNKVKDYFKVGDEKELIIDEYDYKAFSWINDQMVTKHHSKTTYHVQILGFEHDIISKTNQKAKVTFGLKEIMEAKQTINYIKSTIGGWKYCEMRKYLRHNVFDNLPDDLKLIIKPVDKLTSKGEENDEIETTSDKLFLLSESEVFDKIVNSAIGEGNQYQYFVDGGSKIKYRLDSSYSWWLRSPRVNNKFCFDYVNSTPSCNYYAANSFDGVVFGFCI